MQIWVIMPCDRMHERLNADNPQYLSPCLSHYAAAAAAAAVHAVEGLKP